MMLAAALRSRARMLRHGLFPGRGRRAPRGAVGTQVTVSLAFVLGVLAYLAIRGMLSLLLKAGGSITDAAAMLAVLANLTMAGMLVFDLHEAVTALLADSDLDLLRRAPLRPPALLAIKLIDALPRTSLLLLVMMLPAVLAFHGAFGLPLWGWALIPVQALSLWALPLGLGAAAALLLLRIVPARHAREALGLVSSLTLFALWLANSFLLPRLGGEAGALDDVRSALSGLARGMPGTPGGWLAAALAAEVAGDLPRAWLGSARLVGAAAASLVLVAWIASVNLERVQARMLVAPRRRGRVSPARARAAAAPTTLVRAMLRRDGRLIGRNWTILGDLLTTVVLWTLLPVVFGPLFETTPEQLARIMLLALAVAVGSETGARAVPLEREALTWARLSPAAPAQWLGARLVGAALLAAALLSIATLGSVWALGLGVRAVLGVLALVTPALGLALGLGVWAGVAFGDPAWTNPRAMLHPAGRIITTLLLVVQAVVWIGIASRSDGPSAPAAWVIAATLVAAVAVALAFADAARRLGRLEVTGA